MYVVGQAAGLLHLPGGGSSHQVLEPGDQRLVANVTADQPQFTLGGLAPGLDYVVKVYSFNSRGRSEPYVLDGFSLKVAENRMAALQYWSIGK
ncbi:hypothetical protein E2C01_011635 [Portunus trituberculatus]|uniref:Fibronectin type-III domain-containing protein n=1 Tax=Portunus trituberculatus TaxID=210409 RepID=A0A5B7DBN1_PORTR|nr:hypothetical protein [Portunus trituberculatus]